MANTRIASRAALIAAALGVQGVVLSAGWFVTFRIVQRSFARVIQERTIDQNRDLAERVAALFPADGADMVEFGSPEWERLQSIIETDALQELPAGGFACLIQPDGQLLCHPEIRDDPGLQRFSFGGKDLLGGVEADASAVDLLTSGVDEAASGVVEFTAGDFHYVATQPLAGSDLRLLVHQPVGALVSVSGENTRWVMCAAALAVVGVLGITGVGLGSLLRRYDSVHEALNKQLKANLEVARTIQVRSLPRALPSPEGYAIAGWSEPADETGGDTFDVFALPAKAGQACSIDRDAGTPATGGGCVAFLLADATGHGIGPALAVTQLNAMARLAWRMGGSLLDVARLVNTELDARLPEGRFVTAVFGVLDTATHTLEIVSAGQGPLLVWRDADGSVEELPGDTYPLGVMGDLGVSETRRIELAPGDAFCAISDGIFEAMDAANEQFGTRRVGDVLRGHGGGDLETLAHAIGAATDAFTRGAPPDDDRTVLLIRRDRA